jgi:hypothetical protein
MVNVHTELPVHAPDHPLKPSPLAGVSERITCVFCGNIAEHAVELTEQLIPAGVLVTVPVPAPAKATVKLPPGLKAAPMLVAAVSVTAHAPVPVQAPLQPVK